MGGDVQNPIHTISYTCSQWCSNTNTETRFHGTDDLEAVMRCLGRQTQSHRPLTKQKLPGWFHGKKLGMALGYAKPQVFGSRRWGKQYWRPVLQYEVLCSRACGRPGDDGFRYSAEICRRHPPALYKHNEYIHYIYIYMYR